MTSLTFEGFFSGSAKPIAASFNLPFEHSALTGFCSKLLTILRIGPVPVHDAFRKFIFAQPRTTAIFAPRLSSATLHQALSPRAAAAKRSKRPDFNVLMAELCGDRLHDLIFPGRRCGRKSTATPQRGQAAPPATDALGLGYISLTIMRRAKRRRCFFLDRIISREPSCFFRPLEDRRQPQLSGRIA
jgi:hypothetical protein